MKNKLEYSYNLVITIILSISLGEFGIMQLLPHLNNLSAGQAALLDATLLSIFSGIIVYFIIVIPLEKEIRKIASDVADHSAAVGHFAEAMIAKSIKFPRRLILFLMFGIFTGQALIMANLPYFTSLNDLEKSMLDSIVTILIVTPLVFSAVIAPLQEEMDILKNLLKSEGKYLSK